MVAVAPAPTKIDAGMDLPLALARHPAQNPRLSEHDSARRVANECISLHGTETTRLRGSHRIG